MECHRRCDFTAPNQWELVNNRYINHYFTPGNHQDPSDHPAFMPFKIVMAKPLSQEKMDRTGLPRTDGPCPVRDVSYVARHANSLKSRRQRPAEVP